MEAVARQFATDEHVSEFHNQTKPLENFLFGTNLS